MVLIKTSQWVDTGVGYARAVIREDMDKQEFVVHTQFLDHDGKTSYEYGAYPSYRMSSNRDEAFARAMTHFTEKVDRYDYPIANLNSKAFSLMQED